MNLTNATRFPAGYTMGMEPDGHELIVVVVKATFTVPEDGGAPLPAKEQVPLVEADLFEGEPGLSAPLYESDFAPKKPKCDVLFNGCAHAPGGKPAESVPVMLQVGSMSKSFNVVGNRAWVEGLLGWKATPPVPFVKMPISYSKAFGGRDLSDPDDKKYRWYNQNHAGVGFHSNLYPPLIEGKLLPNTEELGQPVGKPDGRYRPMGFGPIGRGWEPRIKLAGTYDQKWLEGVRPFLPSDFNELYYQSSPADQQIPHLQGGEGIVMVNLTPKGRTAFQLPSMDVPVTWRLKGGRWEEVKPVLDTVVIEPELTRVALTLRTSFRPKKNVFEVSEIVVGRMARGWYRARKLGKLYCNSVQKAIAVRRGPFRRSSPP